jgi:acyl carrier protein
MSPLQKELRRMIARQLGIGETILQEDIRLADIGLDSLQVAEIVIAVERRTSKLIDISDLGDLLDVDATLGQLLHMIEQKLAEHEQ